MRPSASVLKLAVGTSGASVVNLVISVAAGIVLARTAGPTGTGFMNLALTVATFTATLLAAGTGLALRFLSAGTPDPGRVGTYLFYSLVLVPIAGALTVPSVLVVTSEGLTVGVGMAVAALGGANLVSKQLQELAQAHGDVIRSIRSVGVGTLTRIILLVIAAALWTDNLAAVAWAFVIGVAVQGIYASWPFSPGRHLATGVRRHAEDTKRDVSEMLRIGRPSLGYSLGMMGLQRTDRVVIASLLGPTALGFYAVAATLSEIMRVATAPLGQLVFVRVTKDRKISGATRQIILIGLGGQVTVGALLWVAAPHLITVFYTDAFAESIPLVRGLIVAEVFMGLVLMESRAVLGMGAMRRMGRDTVLLVALAVPVYLVLIWAYDLMGAIAASVITYALYAAITHLALRHSLRGTPS